jgi:hypothetical protein
LRKEIGDMTLISLIPIHMHMFSDASLDDIVDKLVLELHRSADTFNTAAEGLRVKAREYSEEVVDKTNRFIEVFESSETSCFAFFAKSRRFRISKCQLPDSFVSNPILICLGTCKLTPPVLEYTVLLSTP